MEAGMRAARDFAKAINQSSKLACELEVRKGLLTTLERISNLAKHSSAEERRRFDQPLNSAIARRYFVASEGIIEFFQSLSSILEELPVARIGGARRKLMQNIDEVADETFLLPMTEFATRFFSLSEDFESLSAEDQLDCIEIFSLFVCLHKGSGGVRFLFDELRSALQKKDEPAPLKVSAGTNAFIEAVGRSWLREGLTIGRGSDDEDVSYRGPFHRYCEYFATAVIEPWTARHDPTALERIRMIQKAARDGELARLREVLRLRLPGASRIPWDYRVRPLDEHWLISTDQVRRATTKLKSPLKK
jgi:hypothetical protein